MYQISNLEVNNLIKKLSKISTEVKDDVKKEIKYSVLKIESEAKQNVPVAFGILRNSIRPILSSTELSGSVYVNSLYAFWVEFGRKAGGFPPLNNIKEWVKKKVNSDRKKIDSITYLIARKIAQEGTKPQPYLYPAYHEEKEKFYNRLKNKLKNIGK